MGFLDRLKGKATKAADQHGDKVSKGIDQAAGMADRKTKGKYSDKIGKGSAKAKGALDGLDGKNDDLGRHPSTPPATPPSTPPSTPPADPPANPPRTQP